MECFHCNCDLSGHHFRPLVGENIKETHNKAFCSKPCAQAVIAEDLVKGIQQTKIRMVVEDDAYFKKVYTAEYLLLKAIYKHSKMSQLLMLKKCMMDAVVNLLEFVISDKGDGTVSNGQYLRLANSSKERFENVDGLIKLFGSP